MSTSLYKVLQTINNQLRPGLLKNKTDAQQQSLITCILLILTQTDCKTFQTSFAIKKFKSPKGWFFLDKMVLNPGTAKISFTSQKVQGNPFGRGNEIVLDIIEQEKWAEEQNLKCKGFIKSPLLLHELQFNGEISFSELQFNVEKEQYYYFVLKDCSSRLLNDYNNDKMQIDIKMEVMNNGHPMGEEEDHWMVVPIIVGLGFWLVFSNKDFLRRQFQHDPDYAKMILFGGIATNVSSLIWKSFGYMIYLFIGTNYTIFHLIYLMMHAISETMVIGLLILIGLGWSINYLSGPNMDLSIPAFSFVAMVNILSSLLTQLGNTPHDMHHTFDAVAGNVLIVIRLLIALVFVGAVCWTYSTSRYKVKKFITFFGVLGFLYICSLPILVLIGNTWVMPRERNEFIFISVEIVKSACNICLMYMVSSTKSSYSKLSYKNSSFLPQDTGAF